MLLVDVHCHLDNKKFGSDLPNVIKRAKEAGISSIITSGVNTATNRLALELQKKYDIVKASLGMYPIDALSKELDQSSDFVRDISPTNVDEEIEFMKKNKDDFVAIGEAGLDYFWVKNKQKEMKEVFQKVIELTEKIKKPIIVHTRKAELDCLDMLESSKIKNIILHCFQGRKHLIKRAADNGWNFSIPPIITRLQHFQLLVEKVNINQLLTETDAPYLSPYPEKINEPSYVIETIKKIAEIKNMDQEEAANNIYKNYQSIF